MRSITIGWGTVTRSHRHGPDTVITAYGDSAPEIEADALLRVASRFAPGAVLEFNPEYTMREIGLSDTLYLKEEAATRLPGTEEPRGFYAQVRVREVRS